MILNCRICLGENADKDIYTLPMAVGVEKSSEDIIFFCLGIELSLESQNATKLCSKCHEHVEKYYKFKLLAQESNSILNSLKWNDEYLNSSNLFNDEPKSILSEQVKEDFDYENYVKLKPEVLDDNFLKEVEEDTKLETVKVEQYEPTNPTPVPCPKVYTKKKIKKKVTAFRNKKSVPQSLICKPCEKTFTTKYNLKAHQGKFHSGTKKFQCDHCQLSFFRKFDLQRHIDKLHMEWRCVTCLLLLKSRLGYLKHCETHREGYIKTVKTEIKTKPEMCPVCGKMILNLAYHMERHKANPKMYHCKVCDKKYRSGYGRDRHYRMVHQGLVDHCDICDKDVKSLEYHIRYHHRADDCKRSCFICGHLAVSAASLTHHLSTHLEPHIRCPNCPKLFKSDERLNMHSRQVHEREIRHRCSICPKGFFYKSDLTIHLASHTLKRPYQCDHCYEQFKLRRDIIKHFKTKHKQ